MIKEILASLIAGAFAIPLGILFVKIYQESKAKKERKEWRKERLHFARTRLHKLALKYRDDCMAATESVIAQYTRVLDWKSYIQKPDYMTYSFLRDYLNKIDALKDDYLLNYAKKYADGDNGLQIEAEDLLSSSVYYEYEAEISEIAKIFRSIHNCMRQRLEELKENNE